ncbi:caspase family protein [[Limnothrix rosea] IAM M-220]|uniref:caspase family protein n=1 Tax=[Limnothrix rosea] IAM M-220 TaxID=454133 RepID=UPI00095CC113|nr:caspase family protein [[Limnothrix rosea] IAM M-220]OKH17338.1 hypothetical protein NIES208_09600 [[Limnothrix rosea] IAM M-220]
MTNYNFIGIGINSYQHVQPLSYAQADIEDLERFFCEEARISSCQTLTFTDNSPWVNEEPTYPTRKNLLDWIERGFSKHGSTTNRSGSSILWFVFSGYAVQHLGEDYLLPIDAQLDNPAATGIPISKVFNALRQQGAGKIIALLDMNRSTAVVGNGEVGEQTLDLAGQMGIAAILSCKPEEFSHETAALGHGMFTASVLEALRYHRSDLTLDLLNRYLGDRLQELSEHHWRPVQTPMMVIPSLAASRELILPTGETSKIHWQTAIPIGASLAEYANGKETEPPFTNGHGHSSHIKMGANDDTEPLPTDQPAEVVIDDLVDYPYSSDGDDLAIHDFDVAPIDEEAIFVDEEASDIDPTEPAMMPTGFGQSSGKDKDKQPWYLASWQWLLLLLLLLLGALGWQAFKGEDFNFAFWQTEATDSGGGEASDPSATNPDGSPRDGSSPATVDGSETEPGNVGEHSTGNDATIAGTGNPALPITANPTGTDSDNAEAGNTDAGNGSNTPNGAAGNTTAGNNGISGNIDNASGNAAGEGNSTAATAAANGQSNGATSPSVADAGMGSGNGSTAPAAGNNRGNRGTAPAMPSVGTSVIVPNGAELQTQNESILTEASQVLRSSQASSFNQAIAAARTIKPGTPLYNEARTQINRWSRVILDIAEARAMKGDIAGAIAAARLVPSDVPQVYGLAQNSIKKWEPQLAAAQKNRQIIANAKEEIIPNQASSYSRGINILKTIKPNEPAFAEARVLQDQWSRTIYLLANSRAAQGKYKLAVQTAKLVPADSPSHSSAMGAIARWNKGVR